MPQQNAPLLIRRQPIQPLPSFANPSPRVEANPRQLYTYLARFTSVAALGASASVQSITVDNDADFDWMYSTYYATLSDTAETAATRLVPSALVEVFTQDTQRMSNLPMPIDAVFGSGEQPMVNPTARRLARRTIITFNVTNLGADAINLWLCLMGQKVFG